MNITSKSRYAVKIMLDLWLHKDQGLQQRQNIASRQGIPLDFMDHILSSLRNSGIIQSIRGRKGGFKIEKDPKNINLWQIITSVEDNPCAVKCVTSACERQDQCISYDAWNSVFFEVENIFQKWDLETLGQNLLTKNTHIFQTKKDYIGC